MQHLQQQLVAMLQQIPPTHLANHRMAQRCVRTLPEGMSACCAALLHKLYVGAAVHSYQQVQRC
jgi:hypothetical protein